MKLLVHSQLEFFYFYFWLGYKSSYSNHQWEYMNYYFKNIFEIYFEISCSPKILPKSLHFLRKWTNVGSQKRHSNQFPWEKKSMSQRVCIRKWLFPRSILCVYWVVRKLDYESPSDMSIYAEFCSEKFYQNYDPFLWIWTVYFNRLSILRGFGLEF